MNGRKTKSHVLLKLRRTDDAIMLNVSALLCPYFLNHRPFQLHFIHLTQVCLTSIQIVAGCCDHPSKTWDCGEKFETGTRDAEIEIAELQKYRGVEF